MSPAPAPGGQDRSGFLLAPDGYIVDSHVVRRAVRIGSPSPTGDAVAESLGDPTDLALIRVEDSGLTQARRFRLIRPGQLVVAIKSSRFNRRFRPES
jgi:S1-C subfamily serine protease